MAFGESLEPFREAARRWVEDDAASMGAALAFYSLFSMAPLLLLVMSMLALFVDADVARRLIFDQLTQLLGAQGAEAVRHVLRAANQHAHGFVAAAGSVAMLVVGATTVLAELRRDLDRIWRYRRPAGASWLALVHARLRGLGVVLAIGFLLLVSLLLSAAVGIVASLWGSVLPGTVFVLRALELIVSFAVVTGLFATIYKILPSVSIAWKDAWTGGAITSLLFAVGKWLIGAYIGRSAVTSPFGAAGTLVAVIVWVYYSAQVFFMGAEITRAYADRADSPD